MDKNMDTEKIESTVNNILNSESNPGRIFEVGISNTVNTAAKAGVNPAIIIAVLEGVKLDVLLSIKEAGRMANAKNSEQKPESN